MEAYTNTTSQQSQKKSMEVGDPRMAEMEEQEKKIIEIGPEWDLNLGLIWSELLYRWLRLLGNNFWIEFSDNVVLMQAEPFTSVFVH